MRGWQTSALLREARRNVMGGTLRWAVTVAIAGGVLVAGALVGQDRDLTGRLADLGDRGRGVVVIGSADPDVPVEIDRASCDALTERPDVVRSGLLTDPGRHDLGMLGRSVAVLGTSSTLAPALIDHEALVGSALGLPTGPRTLDLGGPPVAAMVGASEVPETGMASAVVVPLTSPTGPRCVVQLSPWADPTMGAETLAALVATGGPLTAHAVLTETTDTLAGHRDRPERLLPLAAGAAGALITALLTATRAGGFAGYRLSGTSRRDLLRLLALEQAHLAGAFATSGTLATVVLLGWSPAAAAGAAWILAGALTWYILAAVGWPIVLRNPFDLGKER